MIHVVHDRPTNTLKIFDTSNPSGALVEYTAGSDAWGNYGASDGGATPVPPWGFCCRIPPGHYILRDAVAFPTPMSSEGPGQIGIVDIDDATIYDLATSGFAQIIGQSANIGHIQLPLRQLTQWHRDGLLIHGGGTNLGSHFDDDYQRLLRTFGCVRAYNADLKELISLVEVRGANEHIIYSAYGDPAALPGF